MQNKGSLIPLISKFTDFRPQNMLSRHSHTARRSGPAVWGFSCVHSVPRGWAAARPQGALRFPGRSVAQASSLQLDGTFQRKGPFVEKHSHSGRLDSTGTPTGKGA